jgi:integrase
MRIPSYRLHKGTGQAVVTVEGKDHYLGRHGSVESRDRYRRLISEFLATGRAPSREGDDPVTIGEAMVSYLGFVDRHYRLPDGRPTSQVDLIKAALRVLRKLYQDTPAQDFGPVKLKTVREEFVRQGLSRNECNRRTQLVVQFFKWLAAEELVPATNIEALRCVRGLERGRTQAPDHAPIGPVPDDVVDKTLACLPPVIRAMVELQRLSGMRPAEVCTATTESIDRTGDVWEYRPVHHKTSHHGKSRVVLIGPRAQTILSPYLRPDEAGRPLFGPRRKTASRSSQAPASAQRPKRRGPDRYHTTSYRRAIHRGCDRAGIAPWNPNQLRHSAATKIRSAAGLDIAGTVLGHSDLATTQVYAERDLEAAKAIVAKLG